jgi:hypothetical protein
MTAFDSPYEPNLFEHKVAASQRQTDPLQIDVQNAFCRLDVSVFVELKEAVAEAITASVFDSSTIQPNQAQHSPTPCQCQNDWG